MNNKIENTIKKIKKIILEDKNNYECQLKLIEILANLYYCYNQRYADFDIENYLVQTKSRILKYEKYTVNENIVLFYDSFGLDLRGWAASYVRALSQLGYYVVYVTTSKAQGKIPHIIGEMKEDNYVIKYIENNSSNTEKAQQINKIFKDYKPCTAFFYTTPNDVGATLAFNNNDSTTRIQVDLTDHAYWLGICAFDYILDSREMGASIAHFYRNIPTEKIIKLDCAPYINNEKCEKPLPFDIKKEKYIFTGGALYKTLGDKQLLFYKTINYILDKYKDIKYLYAGTGDTSEISKLINRFPDRVFLIPERLDFFELMINSIFYLNSYPMFGGLMMRYAVLAGKVPITLKHENDSAGILINQENLGIEFEDFSDYIKEIDLLITNQQYRQDKESAIKESVISENNFKENLKILVEQKKTNYKFEKIEKFDTSKFKNEYLKRFTYKELCKIIANKQNIQICKHFFKEFIYGSVIKVKENIIK